jgi:IPT/TIG domain
VPTAGSNPSGIAAGPDGALWFTEYLGNEIGQAVFVTATMSVSPSSGSYQTNLTFTGSMFAPNESVEIYTSGVGSAVLATATADSSGSFTVTAREPQGTYGARLFLGVGRSSGKLGAASFSVKPRLILNPTSGAPGSTVTATGYGFGPLEQVTVTWENPSTLLGTVRADIHGTFGGNAAVTFTVPAGAPVGANRVVGEGKSTRDTAGTIFTVQ